MLIMPFKTIRIASIYSYYLRNFLQAKLIDVIHMAGEKGGPVVLAELNKMLK